ncbi:MAG: hypothetical protein L0221_10790 [Chloroflexi bacterium]|nr:hypothetical protein [Chloroflexota bacterium]
MGNTLKAGGQVPDFAGSMAAAMESALNTLLVAEGRPAVPTDDSPETRDRRVMFLAIAQGIVAHLVANQDAFQIVDDDGDPLANHHVVIGHTP